MFEVQKSLLTEKAFPQRETATDTDDPVCGAVLGEDRSARRFRRQRLPGERPERTDVTGAQEFTLESPAPLPHVECLRLACHCIFQPIPRFIDELSERNHPDTRTMAVLPVSAERTLYVAALSAFELSSPSRSQRCPDPRPGESQPVECRPLPSLRCAHDTEIFGPQWIKLQPKVLTKCLFQRCKGSKTLQTVELRRFELLTSSMRTKRSTN